MVYLGRWDNPHRARAIHLAALDRVAEVWEIIKRYRVIPHPAYRLGWGRVSCWDCIFGTSNQWASLQAIAPVLVVVNIGTDSKEDWEEIQGQMEAIALKASKHVSLCSWPYGCRGWDWVPPAPPVDNRIKVKTLDIKTAAGSLIAQIEIGEELKVRVDRTVFGSTENEMLVVLGDGQPLEGFDLPISKWG